MTTSEMAPVLISAETALNAAYEEWCFLADAEAEAICERNWPAVTECEGELRKLQDYILNAAEAAQQEWARAGVESKTREASLRDLISDLTQLQIRNQNLLAKDHQEAQAQIEKLEQKCRNLQRRPRFGFPLANTSQTPACAA